jgi:hypothetical protein
LYTAIAPILVFICWRANADIARASLKLCGCLFEGAIIVLLYHFLSLSSSPPVVDASAAPAAMVWSYIGELIFNMLVLVGSVKMADRIVREMMGL